MLAALLLASLVVAPDIVTPGIMQTGAPAAHSREVFRASLSQSGMGTSMPPGIPAPTFVWLASAPTVNSVATSETLSLTGTVEQYGAPFCESGLFARVADQDGSCMVAKNFDANDYYTAAAGYTDIASAALSACALAAPDDSAAVKILASQQSTATNNGWSLRFANIESCDYYVQTTGGNATGSGALSPAPLSQWAICCGTAGATSGIKAYINGVAGSAAAYPAGTATTTDPLVVGASASFTNKFDGRIAGIWIWEGSELTASQVKTFSQQIMGINGSRNEAATFTNTGPVYAWVDGQIHAFSDDFPIIGAAIAPGMTGAGSPAAGYYAGPSVTVSNLSSRDLSTNWTAVGAGVVACSQTTTPFADARTTCKLTDNDGAAVEYIHQSINVTSLNTGDTIQVCLYAAADSAQTIDLQVAESGVCGGSTINFSAATIGTTWAVYPFTHTLADGTCTTANYRIAPTDFGVVANQGHAYVLVQIYTAGNLTYCPPVYCESAAAGLSCDSSRLAYAINQRVVSATGTAVGPYKIRVDWAPFMSVLSTSRIVAIDNAAETAKSDITVDTTPALVWTTTPGAADITTAAITISAGGIYPITLEADYDRDVYQLLTGSASLGTSTTARASPAGVTTVRIANTSAGASQMPGGNAVSNVRIYR